MHPPVVSRILAHLGLPTQAPRLAPARCGRTRQPRLEAYAPDGETLVDSDAYELDEGDDRDTPGTPHDQDGWHPP